MFRFAGQHLFQNRTCFLCPGALGIKSDHGAFHWSCEFPAAVVPRVARFWHWTKINAMRCNKHWRPTFDDDFVKALDEACS